MKPIINVFSAFLLAGAVFLMPPNGLDHNAVAATAARPQAKVVHAALSVEGIFCADCVTHIEAALTKVKGFKELEIDPSTGQGMVSYDSNLVTRERLLKAINDTGYKAKWK